MKDILKEKMFEIYDQSPCIIMAADLEMNIKYINQKACEVLGSSQATLCDQKLGDFIRPVQSSKKILATLNQIISDNGRQKVDLEIEVIDAIDELKTVHWQLIPLISDNRDITGCLCHGEDVTAYRKLEYENNERIKELNCFYAISQIMENLSPDTERVYLDILAVICNAMQYSEYASGEITIANRHYRTPKFKATNNSISADIIMNQIKEGSITVYYLDTIPPSENMKLFLNEEKMLLETVAERVARFTERLRMQFKLEEAERFFRTIFEEANDGIIIHDDKGKILMVNDAMQIMTGYSFEELVSLGMKKLISKSDLSLFWEALSTKTDANNQIKRRRFETQLNRNKRQLLDVEISVRQLHGSQYPRYVQSMFRDISRDKMIRNNIRAYTKKVIQVQEEERKRISRELHDDTAQALVSLGMDMDNLIKRDKAVLDRNVAKNLNDHLKRLNEIIRGVEHISQDLRPPMLELLGITEALKLLTHVTSDRYSVPIDFKVIGKPRPLSTEKETTIFRVTQEALFNLGKHANAPSAVVEITFAKDKIGLVIHDDGCGFVLPDDTDNLILSGKLGLIGILERVQLINGVVSVESKPGTGTTISVELPGD